MQSLNVKLRRLKFWIHLLTAYAIRYKIQLSLFIISIFLLFVVTLKIWSSLDTTKILTIGYIGSYSIDTIPAQILSLATKSLVTIDQAGRPIPQLASNWTVSDDGTTYVVFLKDNLRWHDGAPVLAKDISIAISGVQVTAINNKTIEFRLPSNIASFPTILDKPVFKANSFYGTG